MMIPGYRIKQDLHGSGTSKFYRAESIENNHPVLLKILPCYLGHVHSAVEFKNDHVVSVGLSLNSTFVLKPLDFRQSPELTYFVYEDFDAVPLKTILDERRLSILDALQVAINLTDALDDIHRQDRLHRNLTAHNILVDPKTLAIKLSDFRYASHNIDLDNTYHNDATDEFRLGYIAPELTGRLNKIADHRSDYYSLGVILYEMICGSLPFTTLDPLELIHSHIARQPRSPNEVDSAQCPEQLSAIIMKLLAKHPDDRYQSNEGIQHDLGKCLTELKNNNAIVPFKLATHDFSTLFNLSASLFGREKQLTYLQQVLVDAGKGEGGFVGVRGHAGCGKTALIHELVLTSGPDVLFVRGKYEQNWNQVPYSAFIQIIEELVGFLLGEPEEIFNRYKREIKETLGSSVSIVTELVPVFESIVGKQVKPLQLGVDESKNRFHTALSSLLSIFVRIKKPFVMVFDDLQWADYASLMLLETLIDSDWANQSLIITCYRDNFISSNAELMRLISATAEKKNYHDIVLENIEIENIESLLSETLNMEVSKVASLAEYVHKVTSGNPFYARQLLSSMYQDGMIWADRVARCWKWKTLAAVPKDEESGVLELIETSINKLDHDQLDILYHALFLGSQFVLSDLCMVMEIKEDVVIRLLAPLVRMGICSQNGQRYRFKHDRVHQAVRLTVPEDLVEKINLRIGMQLLKHLADYEKDNRLLEITNYLDRSVALMTTEDEFNILLVLNYRSAKTALEKSAYRIALGYSEMALSVIDKADDKFFEQYRFSVYMMLGRCQYLNAEHQQAKLTVNNGFDIASCFKEKCVCYSVLKDVLVSEGVSYQEAVKLGVDIIREQGLPVFEGGEKLQALLAELQTNIENLLQGRNPMELLDSRQLSDPEKVLFLGLLADLWEAAYYDANEALMQYTILSSVSLSIENGNSSESAFGYVLYGMLLTLNGQYQQAHEFGQLALALNERFDDKVMLPKVTNLFCNYINFHLSSFSSSTDLYEKSSLVGRENGDYLFGLWATIFAVWSRFLSGQVLPEVSFRANELQSFVDQTKDNKIIYAYAVLKGVVESLQSPERFDELLDEAVYKQYLEYWQENNFVPGVSWYAILLGQYYCVMGNYEKAYQLLSQNDLVLAPGIIMFPHSQQPFYHCLSLLKLINSNKLSGTPEHISEIDEATKRLSVWSELCPENFLCQKLLLEAEKNRYEGEYWQASGLYNQAIQKADEFGLRPVIAMANELAGDFWREHGDLNLAEYYFQSAIDNYSAWGAMHKVYRLAKETKAIVRDKLIPVSVVMDDSESIHATDLDFTSILKFTQAISKEIDSERLLKTTMSIIIENAGADRGVLFVADGDSLNACLVAEFYNEPILTQLDIPLSQFSDIPKRAINYVQRTGKRVLLDDAMCSDIYQGIDYIHKNTIHSILCLPVFYQDQLKAILYLENKSLTGVFNQERANTLGILLAQMAISLQNAELYQSLNTELVRHKVTAAELEVSKERLRLSHEYAGLGSWDWNIETGELIWSETVAPLIGYKHGEIEVTFDNFINATHPDDRKKISAAIQACFDGAEYRVEHRVVWPDGTIRWLLQAGDVTRDENGKPIRMLGISKDITDQKLEEEEYIRLQKQLQQAQKMEAIGQLTGGIAHDFNNMLAAILGYSGLLKTYFSTHRDPKLENYVNQVISAGQRASSLIAQMLAFSRGDNADVQSINVIPAIKDTIRMLSSTMPSSIKISFDVPSEAPNIDSNAVQLHQILMNICINARDAMSREQGEIEIGVRYHRELLAECSSCHNHVSGSYLELFIQDDAGGIPVEARESIFNPFFSTKEIGKGTGMGLAMVHGLVHSQHGHIILDVDEGKGSCFRLLFPVSSKQSPGAELAAMAQQALACSKPYRVLVVDDEPAIATVLGEMLENADCQVLTCTDSAEAMDIITDRLDQFDILVTDQTMPNINGAQLATKALEIDPSFPVIICTGYSSCMNDEVASELGIKCLLNKPVSLNQLLTVINEVLA